MATCIKCYSEFPDKRKELGYKTCIVCGEKEANKEAIRRSKCTAPLFNKGAYQYIGSFEEIKYIGR